MKDVIKSIAVTVISYLIIDKVIDYRNNPWKFNRDKKAISDFIKGKKPKVKRYTEWRTND